MSLFQCEVCGVCENTALACQGVKGYAETFFDWTGIEDRKGKKLCSVHAPTKYKDGTLTNYGRWHGQFEQRFYEIGTLQTDARGNLEHKLTGDKDIEKWRLK